MPSNQFFIGWFVGVFCFIILQHSLKVKKRPIETTIFQCNHPTEKQIISKYVSYQIFVDSMYVAKKRDIKRFTDSLTKYRIK